MKMVEVLKTIEEANEKRYMRSADYNRQLAFTDFLKEVEEAAEKEGKIFNICCTSGTIIFNRDSKTDSMQEQTKRTLLNTYAQFIYDNKFYHISWNENPFFPHYYSCSNVIEKYGKLYTQKVYSEEYDELSLYLKNDEDLLTTKDVFAYEGNIEKIKRCFHKLFNRIKLKQCPVYDGELSLIKEVIYTF